MSDPHDSGRRALQRILDTPHLAKAVPQLPAELLHRVIQHQGLEDAAEIVALASPEQLARVFDLDLWQPAHAGLDEQFDAERFGVWLHVLLEGGDASAARILAGMSPDLLIAGFAQHVRVFDVGTELPYTCELGGYRILARRDDAWDPVVDALLVLEQAEPARFHRVMAGCRALSNSKPEESGMHVLLDDAEQAMFELAVDREERRSGQGFVTPAQAHAFLEMARRGSGRTPAANPIATAYFRAIEDQAREAEPSSHEPQQSVVEVTGLVEVLLDSGILAPHAQALLPAGDTGVERLVRIHAALRSALERDPDDYARCSGELGYLANTLMSACTIQSRPLTPQEASDAAIATCNLGLEHTQDLVGAFQIGWGVLYERVTVAAARRLRDTLAHLQCRDRDTQIGISRLRVALGRQLAAGTPWRARPALDVLASLDLPAWAALRGLLDECPVFHPVLAITPGTTVHSVSPTAFEFISENAQLAAIDAFLKSLPAALQA